MLGDKKNLTDLPKDINASYQTSLLRALPYGKTDKLVMALYMVTDIIDNQEPIRSKLRTLGTEILSDMHSISIFPNINVSVKVGGKIAEILSFLDIASTVNIVSTMNSSILKKEFIELKKIVEEPLEKNLFFGKQPTNLIDFLKEDLSLPTGRPSSSGGPKHPNRPIGHIKSARLGVQKGSTLMQALSDKKFTETNFNLKNERREEIVLIIKSSFVESPGIPGLTITDIKVKAKGPLLSCGEKTLQRELVSMVKDNVLKKTGEKRWSRYFLA